MLGDTTDQSQSDEAFLPQLLCIKRNSNKDVKITWKKQSITVNTRLQFGFFCKTFSLITTSPVLKSNVFIALQELRFSLLTVNHLTPTGNKQSVCQQILHQKHIKLDVCHIYGFGFRKHLLVGTSVQFCTVKKKKKKFCFQCVWFYRLCNAKQP